MSVKKLEDGRYEVGEGRAGAMENAFGGSLTERQKRTLLSAVSLPNFRIMII